MPAERVAFDVVMEVPSSVRSHFRAGYREQETAATRKHKRNSVASPVPLAPGEQTRELLPVDPGPTRCYEWKWLRVFLEGPVSTSCRLGASDWRKVLLGSVREDIMAEVQLTLSPDEREY